jgi:hypothetical protein
MEAVEEYIKNLPESKRQVIEKSLKSRTKGRPYEITELTVSRTEAIISVNYTDGSGKQGWTLPI